VSRLLASQPEERMTCNEALIHPWLTGITHQPPRKGEIRTTLMEDKPRSWLDQHLQRPIITFSTSEKIREKGKRSSSVKSEKIFSYIPPPYNEESSSSEEAVFLWDIQIDPAERRKRIAKDLQRKRELEREKDKYIRDLFLYPYYSSSSSD